MSLRGEAAAWLSTPVWTAHVRSRHYGASLCAGTLAVRCKRSCLKLARVSIGGEAEAVASGSGSARRFVAMVSEARVDGEVLEDKTFVARKSPPPRFYEFAPQDVLAVRLTHVRVETEQLADYIVATVAAGENTFQQLALSVSELHGHASSMRWIRNPRTQHLNEGKRAHDDDMLKAKIGEAEMSDVGADLDAALVDAAFRVRPQTLSKVAASAGGWHVFLVDDAVHALKVQRVRESTERRFVRKISKLGFSQPASSSHANELPQLQEQTYFIATMGCQANKADSERMAGELERAGFHAAANELAAQVVVFNTCSIREHAETKLYGVLGVHAARKRCDARVQLLVAGCVAQQEGEALLRRVPELDVVLGPQYANRVGELVSHSLASGAQLCATAPAHIGEDLALPRRASAVTAWVNVIYGCNERCTYCVVPATRGLEQSRSMAAIRAEIEQLAAQGIREVVLLGQNVDAYGRDLAPRQTFSELLEHVHEVRGIERIRFMTSHPRYMSARLIAACARLPKVCEHFHVPFQAGDDDVLRRMSRGYTAARFLRIVAAIRDAMPDAAISADAIVGFPGETDAQFERTLQLMDAVRFDLVNTAAYSPRPNTPAATWDAQLTEDVKQARLAAINAKVREHAAERSARLLGSLQEVLVEARNPKNAREVSGRTRGNRLAFFEGELDALLGKLVIVRITETHPFYLRAERVAEHDPW